MPWRADLADVKKVKAPLGAKSAIWYNMNRQDIKRRLAAKLVAPTEWNTTVVAEEAMCPKGKHVPVRSRVLNTGCAAVRLRGNAPLLNVLADKRSKR